MLSSIWSDKFVHTTSTTRLPLTSSACLLSKSLSPNDVVFATSDLSDPSNCTPIPDAPSFLETTMMQKILSSEILHRNFHRRERNRWRINDLTYATRFNKNLLSIALSDSCHSVVSPKTSTPETAYRFPSPAQLNDSSDSNSWCRGTDQWLSITDISIELKCWSRRFPIPRVLFFSRQDIQLFRQSQCSLYVPQSIFFFRVVLIQRHPL